VNSPAETSRTIERPICTVASDVRNRAADREPDGCPDWPLSTVTRSGRVLCTAGNSPNSTQLLSAMPRVVARLDPNLPVEELRTMEAQVRDNVFVDRIISVLSAAFAGLATLLAVIGLYGVLAYNVAKRTREIGLRMALGAGAGRIRGMVMRQVTRMTLVGGTVGLILAIALGRVAQSLLFELQNTDPLVLIGAVSALTLVALGAGAIPAWRASRIEPMRALHYE